MARCTFAKENKITGSSGSYLGGPIKIVHHTTEGSSARGAFAAYAKNRSDPHFTVDATTIYQHIDTDVAARALRNPPGGVQTNRDGAIQIEVVGFAGKAKDHATLRNVARLCRWIEQQHRVPQVWPAGLPKPAKNGGDPGGHNRDPKTWDSRGGHYGHSQVPENTHWDPGYTQVEADYLLTAQFDAAGALINPDHPAVSALMRASAPDKAEKFVEIADHADVGADAGDEDKDAPDAGTDAAKGTDIKSTGTKMTAAARAKKQNKMERTLDALPDTIDFRDALYSASLVHVPGTLDIEAYRKYELPVLNQGTEGACTGFGLAAVANYLIRIRGLKPDADEVSAWMLYGMAKRYDEWPGEKYDGSSARGAVKGWFKHGLCTMALWKDLEPDPADEDKRSASALERPLGAYYRVNHKDIVAMHAAITEVGVLYATAVVHEGWREVAPGDTDITLRSTPIGGHAFAIVGYDREGFWIQNSWGKDWGSNGLIRLSYADWLTNGTDVWVVALGAPVNVGQTMATTSEFYSAAGSQNSQVYAAMRPHIVTCRNDGELDPKGTYGLTPQALDRLLGTQMPATMKSWKKKRVVLYAHGGLVGESLAIQTAAANRAALLDAEVYPLFFVWRSDAFSTLGNILREAIGKRSDAGIFGRAKEFMYDRIDDTLEQLARHLGGKALWDEMKENALGATTRANGAARLVADRLIAMVKAGEIEEIHLVGHSAGSIFHAPLAQYLCAAGVKVGSLSLWAPACTMELFQTGYRPLIDSGMIEAFDVYLMDDKTEQDDHCADIYHKSLLYLVSNAFEQAPRIRGSARKGTALLGLERDVRQSLPDFWDKPEKTLHLAPGPQSGALHHGDFDNDRMTLVSTLHRITGVQQAVADFPGKASRRLTDRSPRSLMSRNLDRGRP